jgi:hypothetical protein
MIGFYTPPIQNERRYRAIDKRMVVFHTKHLVGAGKDLSLCLPTSVRPHLFDQPRPMA